MRAALRLARRGLGQVWPNPAVGCVLVRDGKLVGRGWTQPGGRPHGEAMALAQAGDASQGATAYVTLEPCAHHGRTPPCADALITAGVKRVVTPLEDPDPRVAGKGHARLREAGITVDIGLEAQAATTLNEGFLLRQRLGRPKLTLKLAASLDGRIATSTGESRWITGPRARAAVHLMRSESDAILIGAGTARTDDPSLDVRLTGLEARSPVRVVVDSNLSLPLSSRMLNDGLSPVWLAHAPGAKGRADAELIEVARGAAGLDPVDLLAKLGAKGVTRIFCEGGGALAASFLDAGLVDELVWMNAGLTLGADGKPAIGSLGLENLHSAARFTLSDWRQIGPDLISIWRPQRQSQA